jgi:predicted DNA-binding transcriptional regulator AlpA
MSEVTTVAGPYGETVSSEGVWWTIDDVADFCGISTHTWRSYVSRGQAPAAEQVYGRTPLWRPDTIREWHSQRPGRGWRAGAKGE